MLCWMNLLNNEQQICLIWVADESGRKENVTYTRHANMCIIKWVTKQILTNMLPNLFINNISFFIMKNK